MILLSTYLSKYPCGMTRHTFVAWSFLNLICHDALLTPMEGLPLSEWRRSGWGLDGRCGDGKGREEGWKLFGMEINEKNLKGGLSE